MIMITSIDSYIISNHETIELSREEGANGRYTVDCWAPNGDNRWCRMFKNKEEALAEFNRWRNLNG